MENTVTVIVYFLRQLTRAIVFLCHLVRSPENSYYGHMFLRWTGWEKYIHLQVVFIQSHLHEEEGRVAQLSSPSNSEHLWAVDDSVWRWTSRKNIQSIFHRTQAAGDSRTRESEATVHTHVHILYAPVCVLWSEPHRFMSLQLHGCDRTLFRDCTVSVTMSSHGRSWKVVLSSVRLSKGRA